MCIRYWLGLIVAVVMGLAADAEVAKGIVFHDQNTNGTMDAGELGVAGVAVSNGRDVVRTDAEGRWSLPVTEDTILFLIKPASWSVPLDADKRPRFFYIHKPHGSPKLDKPGVPPTGPLPDSIDFPLYPHEEPDKFTVAVITDPQTRGLREVDFLSHDIVEEMCGADSLTSGAAFGWCLGDIVADDANLFPIINSCLARTGMPWYAVPGNHDTNRDATEDRYSAETFERVYGPGTYALEYANVVFLAYDNVYVDRMAEARANSRKTNSPSQKPISMASRKSA